MRVENSHARQFGDALDGERAARCVAPQGTPVEGGLPIVHAAERADLGRLEGIERCRVHFNGIAGALDCAIEDDEDALADGLIDGSDAHGLQEVHRAIGAQCRRGAHGSRQHDGLHAVDRQMQEIRRLLHRVRAVRDDDAVDVLARKQFLAARGEPQPDC